MTFAEAVGHLRRSLNRTLAQRVAQASARPLQQLSALRVVARGEVTTQAQLAERLLVDPPAASRLVARLVSEGLVRRQSGRDRRCVCLTITPAGRREARVLDKAMAWLEGEVTDRLSAPERRRVFTVLCRLQETFASRRAD